MSINLFHRCPACKNGGARLVFLTDKTKPKSMAYKAECDACKFVSDVWCTPQELALIDFETWKFRTGVTATTVKATGPTHKLLDLAQRKILGAYLDKAIIIMACPTCKKPDAKIALAQGINGSVVMTCECRASRWLSDALYDDIFKAISNPPDCPSCGGKNIARLPADSNGTYYYSCRDCQAIGQDFNITNEHTVDEAWDLDNKRILDKTALLIRLNGAAPDVKEAKTVPEQPKGPTLVEQFARLIAEQVAAEETAKAVELATNEKPDPVTLAGAINCRTDLPVLNFATVAYYAYPLGTDALLQDYVTGCRKSALEIGRPAWTCPKCHDKGVVLVALARAIEAPGWGFPDYILACTKCGHYSQKEISKTSMSFELGRAVEWVKADIIQASASETQPAAVDRWKNPALTDDDWAYRENNY